MLPPFIRRPRKKRLPKNDPRSKERGVTIALVAMAMVGIIAMAALSIDIGTLYQAKAEAQRAADAAALTAARVISISGITGDPNNLQEGGNSPAGRRHRHSRRDRGRSGSMELCRRRSGQQGKGHLWCWWHGD